MVGPAPLVLVVDDMVDGRELVLEALESAGFRVIGAADGKRALELAFQDVPALIVLDLSLPELDGWQVAQHLKQDPRTRAVPILALSAFALPIHRDRALAAGAASFMAKPCPVSTLLAEARRLIAEAPLQADGEQDELSASASQ